MKQVIIAGSSGHALVAIEVLELSGYEIIGYVDKQASVNNNLKQAYLGTEEEANILRKDCSLFVAIGNNYTRRRVTELLKAVGFSFVQAIHPQALMSEFSEVGNGVLVCRGALINPYTTIGEGTIINTGAIIEHECNIQQFVHVAPGAVLAGNVYVGENSFVGANSVIKQGVRIGANVTVGAGSVVLTDIASGETWYGNPARKYKS